MKQKFTYLFSLLLTALFLLPWNEVKAAQSLPYSYGFEDYNLATDGWTTYFGTSLSSNNSECAIVGAAKKTGTYGFRFSSYNASGANAQYLISPELDAANGLDLTFQYKATNSWGTEVFKVGYSTTDADVANFTWGEEISTNSTGWLQYEGSFPAGTKYVAVYYYSNYQYRLYVDDFTFAATPSCVKPTSLTISSIRSTTATFTWTKGKDETSWQYVCLPAADALDWSGAATATSATATISGLTAETDYKLYVRSDCGSEQSPEVIKAFTTPCADYATTNLPLEENFNDKTAYPDCWSKVAFVSGTTSYPTIYSSNGESGSKSIRFYGGVTGTSEQIAILPPIEEATGNLLLSFWYKNGNASSSYGQFIIGYITDPANASTFQQIGDPLTRNTSGTEVTKFAMTGAPENSFIAIKYAGGSYAQSAYIDNIKVSLPSSCADPSDVNAAAASATSATVSWTENGSATTWNLQYSTDNFATSTSVNGITENPYTLTGLTANTTYRVSVQADCGGDKSDYIASAAFPTPCEPTTGIGWSANFAGASTGSSAGLPDCWVINSTNSYPYIYQYGARSNSRCLYFGGTSTVQPIAVLPPFSEATNTLYVTLWYNNAYDYGDYSASSFGQLAIGYMTNPADASTFVAQEVFARVNTYTQAKVALTDAPAGARVAIRYVNGGSSTGYLFVDDIAITAIPSCMAPSGVTGSATDLDEASISWTANGSETAWKIQYSSDNGVTWSDEIAANANPFTITGLSAQTTYIAQVKADCGGEYSEPSAPSLPFSTPCPPQAASYSFGFETAEGAVNGEFPTSECWKRITTSSYPTVYNYSAKTGSQCLRFYGSGTQYAILPQFNEDVKGLTLSFYYFNYSWGGALSVGYMTDPEDASTFVLVQDLANITSYAAAATEINLSGADAGARYIAFKYVGSESYHYSILDDVVVEKALSCQKPTDVVASNVTATTADVAWTENNSATTWKLQISNDGSAWTDVNSGADITANPYTLTGLTPNHTTYYVRVKSVCGSGEGESSYWSAASEPFETECGSVALPFTEDFSGSIDCWKKVSCDASTGLNNGTFRFAYNTNPPQYLISPEIDTEDKPVTIEFEYYAYSATYPETFKVGYSTTTNEVSAFTWGATTTATNVGSANTLTYSENLPTGVKYVAIQYLSNDKYYLYIDNFSVVEYIAPACPAVSAATLQESAVTAHTATVSWTAGGEETAWNLQYKAAGGEWSEPVAISTTPSYDMTGLTANTLYYVKVQANCGDATSEWTGDDAFSFPTDCEPKAVTKANPWNFGFEDVADGATPSCWERNEAYANHGYPVVAEYSYYAQTGDKYLYFYTPARNGGPAYTEDAILPVFNTEIKNLKVSFAYFNNSTGTNYGQLAIGYVVGDAFTQVGELLAKVEDYTTVEREMPNDAPNGARIAIRCIGSTKSGYSTYAYVDDVVVSLKPTCYVPTALAAAETSDGAVLTWTAGKDESEWNVRYSVKDADEWTVVDEEIAANNYTLTGLSLDVTYEVQVKAVCGVGDESEWSASAEFAPVCNAPSALTVTARTMTSATFSWISSESAWVLQYSVDGENWESENVNANPYTLNNLTAGQTYQAKIQAACGSDFSNVVEFTTVCAMRSAADLPFSEDFTGIADYALPACWESATASVESEKLFFRGADEQIVVLPGYDVALNKLSVSFDYTLNNASMQFGYVETIDGEFHSLAELEGTAFEADLTTAPAFAGYLAFRYYNSLSQYAANTIDNIVVMDKSALALDEKKDNTQVLGELVEQAQPVTITIKRTIFCDGYFNTLCLPFDLDAAALAASPLAGYARLAKFTEATVESGSDELQLVYEYATSIEAGVPYLINFPAGENIVNPTFTNVTISATAGNNVNLGNGIIVKGILKPEPFTAGNEDMLFLLGENKLSWAGVTNNLKGFRAYFQLTDVPAGSPVRRGMNARIVEHEETATGVENAKFDAQAIKFIENNQVVIIRNGVKYNIQGQVIQ